MRKYRNKNLIKRTVSAEALPYGEIEFYFLSIPSGIALESRRYQ